MLELDEMTQLILVCSMPLPFKCSIKPRSRKAVDLIRSTLE